MRFSWKIEENFLANFHKKKRKNNKNLKCEACNAIFFPLSKKNIYKKSSQSIVKVNINGGYAESRRLIDVLDPRALVLFVLCDAMCVWTLNQQNPFDYGQRARSCAWVREQHHTIFFLLLLIFLPPRAAHTHTHKFKGGKRLKRERIYASATFRCAHTYTHILTYRRVLGSSSGI